MRLRTTLIAAGLVPALSTFVLAEDLVRIVDIAPKGTFLVLGANDIDVTCKNFNATPLAGLMKTDAVQKAFGNGLRDMFGQMNEMLDGAELEVEMTMPASMGLAMYADLDEETGMARAFMVGFSQWKGDGEDAGKMMEFLTDEGADAGAIKIDLKEIRGREVMVIEMVEEDDQDMGEDDFGGGGMDAMMMFGDPREMAPDFSTMFVTRDGGRVLFANDLLAIDDALACMDGDRDRTLASTEDWKNTETQLGDPDAFMLLRTDPLQELLAPMFMGPLGLVKPMIAEVFGDIRGYGFGASTPSKAGGVSMTMTASILAPGKREGLLELFGETAATGQMPPKVVTGDAMGYGRMNVDFKGLVPLADRVTAAMPMGGEEMEMAIQQFGPMVEAGLGTMGPAVHVISTVSRPIEIDSAATTLLIPTNDPEKVQPLLSMFGPGMNLEPRDFLGETLWSSEVDGMAAAVAGNWVVMGSPRGVEQVIRSLGAGGDGNDLASVAVFSNAVDLLPDGDSVGWGWSDLVAGYAVQRENMQNMIEMVGGGGFDEFAPDAGLDGIQTDAMLELFETLSPKELSRYVGPTIWNFTTDDLGWVYRQWVLAPVEQDKAR